MRIITDGVPEKLTIDALARLTGMTVRNIRAHQSRGLLQPPEIEGRTGYYGPKHVARIELISEMQADGFNLAAIKKLLEDRPGSDSEMLGFKRALMAPWEDEEHEFITVEELGERLRLDPANPNPKLLSRAINAGFLVDLGEGRFEVPSPTLFHAAEELRTLGIDTATALDVLDEIQRASRSIARSFVKLFVEEVWRPFADAGQSENEWPDVRSAIERLRPLATDAVMAVFRRTMTDAVEQRFGEELERRADQRSSHPRARASRGRRAHSGRSRG
ncbi:MAG TPA: MerR family transcriptional regulator [Thermoleophilaceae bacterium]|nr:MerR family transcriptional regulator [Thermoleophilaceae bacterium]